MRFQLRTDPSQPAVPGAALLDWFPGERSATVQSGAPRRRTASGVKALLAGLTPPDHALGLLNIAVATYCADRVTLRDDASDAWTRDVSIRVPVAAGPSWDVARPHLVSALDFLTGDEWTVTTDILDRGEPAPPGESPTVDAVCLFSGGLDSLAGAIDVLDSGRDVLLVGHYEGGLAPNRQDLLAAELQRAYPDRTVELRQFFLRPARGHQAQLRPLPSTRENTTRGRSFLFLAAGFAVAAAIGPDVPLHIPENGLIGINVPLTGSRPASLSTRTTHPYFLSRVRAAMDAVGYSNPLVNPYRLKTKGEMISASCNPTLLRTLAEKSISCSHPEAARYAKRLQGNCGYCYPCMIRRAALHAADLDSPSGYAYDIDADADLIESTAKGASLRALVRALSSQPRRGDVLRNGPIPDGETGAFADVYVRGREELRAWLLAHGSAWAKRELRP